jgi:hypothetical protein
MWDDQIKQVSGIEAAGGLNRSLILKASGTGGPLFHQPDTVTKTAAATLTPEEVMSRYVIVDSESAIDITLPSAVSLAAYLNGGAASRNGTKLWPGACFYFTILKDGANAATLVAGTGWTIQSSADGVATDTAGSWLFRFTDVTVGAETIEALPLAGAA